MISHWFDVPCETLKVSLRDGEEQESNLWMAEDAFGYVQEDERGDLKSRWDHSKRKNILIVDDINDTGDTFNWIMQDWVSGCLPEDSAWKDIWSNNVKFAVLVDNQASRCQRAMDYVGMEINKAEDDVWVDFPWESWYYR